MSCFDHHVVILDTHRERLGLVRSFNELHPLLNRHCIAARAQPLRIAPGLPGADVELPRMPWAADDLAAPRVAVLARPGRLHQPGLLALAQAAALVGAAIVQREELAAEIEHHDGAAIHIDKLAVPRRNIFDRSNDMPRHQVSPYSFLALPA